MSKEAGEGELTEDEFLDRLRVRTYLPGQFFGEYQLRDWGLSRDEACALIRRYLAQELRRRVDAERMPVDENFTEYRRGYNAALDAVLQDPSK